MTEKDDKIKNELGKVYKIIEGLAKENKSRAKEIEEKNQEIDALNTSLKQMKDDKGNIYDRLGRDSFGRKKGA